MHSPEAYGVAIERLTRTVTGPGVTDVAWTRLAVAQVNFPERKFIKAESGCRKTRTSWNNVLQVWHGIGRLMASMRLRMMEWTGCLPHLKHWEQV